MHERIVRILIILVLSIGLVGCPVTIKFDLYNASQSNIEVLSGYSDTVIARIDSGEKEKVVFNPDCMRIRVGERIIEFKPVMPDDKFLEIELFHVYFSATFTDNESVVIHSYSKGNEAVRIKKIVLEKIDECNEKQDTRHL